VKKAACLDKDEMELANSLEKEEWVSDWLLSAVGR